MRTKSAIAITLLTLGLLLAACGNNTPGKKINIAYANWADGIAITYLTKVIFEDQGYEVKLQNADLAPIFTSLSRKKADAFMDVWMPSTHGDYMERYSDELEIIGTTYDNAQIGLVVPKYVTIHSIEELNANKERFSGKIIGIDAGGGIMRITEKALIDYELDFKLMTSSGPAMTASLKKAIDNGEWIVVTGWTPHWMFDRYELKVLEDPKKVFGTAETIHTVTWKGFSKQDPFAAKLLSNVHLTDVGISSLMTMMQTTEGKEEDAAREWIKANKELVDSWIPKEEE